MDAISDFDARPFSFEATSPVRQENWLGTSRLPIVVKQQTAQMLATLDITHVSPHFFASFNQPVLKTLMVSLAMIVADISVDSPARHFLAKEDHPIQAFFAQAPPKSLQMGIEIRRMWWQPDGRNPGIAEDHAKRLAELGVTVHEEITFPQQEAVIRGHEVPSDLLHPGVFGLTVVPEK